MNLIKKIIDFLIRLFLGKSRDKQKFPYKKKDYLLTVAERNFYEVLSKIVQEHNKLLFAKVRLEDLFWMPKGTENRFGYRNRIKSRHIDFLICDKENIKPILAVELDDSSHDRGGRRERDNFIDEIMNEAGLPILHVKFSDFYDIKELNNKIINSLKK